MSTRDGGPTSAIALSGPAFDPTAPGPRFEGVEMMITFVRGPVIARRSFFRVDAESGYVPLRPAPSCRPASVIMWG